MFWAPNELNELLKKYVLNFPPTWLANRQWFFKQTNHGAYANPDTQVKPRKGLWQKLSSV